MRKKLIILFFFCSILSLRAQQQTMFADVFNNFITTRFWQYEPLEIVWNMEGTIQANLNEGINNLIENRPDLAVSNFTDVIKKDSSVWQAYYFRAACEKKTNKLLLAQKDLERALKLKSRFYEGHIELAKVFHLNGYLAQSEQEIKRAIQIDKHKPIAYYLKGDVSLQRGQQQEAIHSYKACLETDSLFHDARLKLALLHMKDEQEALRLLTQVLTYDSIQKNALLFRSLILYKSDKKRCAKDLTSLIKVDPDNVMARYLRGQVSSELEDYDRAFLDYQKIIKATSANDNEFKGQQTWLDKKIDLQNVGAYTLTRIYGLSDTDAACLKKAYCLIINREYEKSLKAINQTSNVLGEPLCLYLTAVTYEHQGNHVKALQLYTMALNLDNEIADAHKKRAIYKQEMKQWWDSITDLNAVLRLNPDAFVVYKIRGISYFYMNRFNEAITDLTTYLEHDSTNKEVLNNRGAMFLKMNKRLPAYIDFAKAVNVDVLNFKDMTHLVDSVMATGDTTKTLRVLNALTSGYPYFSEGFVRKFKIHLKRNAWAPIEADVFRAAENCRADAPERDYSYLLMVKGMKLVKTNRTDEAHTAFAEAIKYDKENSLAYLERARLWITQGKKSKAESDLKNSATLGNREAQEILVTLTKK